MQDEGELVGEVTVVDVYDIASDIGKECEKIIDHYGADAVTALMPKVINALELLENLATKNERENTQLLELKSKISQLENDKIEKAEYRQKFEKVLWHFFVDFFCLLSIVGNVVVAFCFTYRQHRRNITLWLNNTVVTFLSNP